MFNRGFLRSARLLPSLESSVEVRGRNADFTLYL